MGETEGLGFRGILWGCLAHPCLPRVQGRPQAASQGWRQNPSPLSVWEQVGAGPQAGQDRQWPHTDLLVYCPGHPGLSSCST